MDQIRLVRMLDARHGEIIPRCGQASGVLKHTRGRLVFGKSRRLRPGFPPSLPIGRR